MKMNNVLRFIEDLETKCKEYGVKLVLYDMKFIENDGDKFGGWFDADNKELHCAFPDKIQTKYVELLVHESCHMDQWIENTKYWTIERRNNSLTEVWKILKGEKVNKLKYHLKNVQMMEAECEKMSIQKIKDYDLGINIERYAMKANSYLLFYSVLVETKKWTDYPPYKFKDIWRGLPDKILSNFEISEDLKQLYFDKCYKKRTKKIIFS